jgi:hypothetical protein
MLMLHSILILVSLRRAVTLATEINSQFDSDRFSTQSLDNSIGSLQKSHHRTHLEDTTGENGVVGSNALSTQGYSFDPSSLNQNCSAICGQESDEHMSSSVNPLSDYLFLDHSSGDVRPGVVVTRCEAVQRKITRWVDCLYLFVLSLVSFGKFDCMICFLLSKISTLCRKFTLLCFIFRAPKGKSVPVDHQTPAAQYHSGFESQTRPEDIKTLIIYNITSTVNLYYQYTTPPLFIASYDNSDSLLDVEEKDNYDQMSSLKYASCPISSEINWN